MDFPVDDGVSCLATNTMKIKKPRRTEAFDGSCYWALTSDRPINSRMLCQLSYAGIFNFHPVRSYPFR